VIPVLLGQVRPTPQPSEEDHTSKTSTAAKSDDLLTGGTKSKTSAPTKSDDLLDLTAPSSTPVPSSIHETTSSTTQPAQPETLDLLSTTSNTPSACRSSQDVNLLDSAPALSPLSSPAPSSFPVASASRLPSQTLENGAGRAPHDLNLLGFSSASSTAAPLNWPTPSTFPLASSSATTAPSASSSGKPVKSDLFMLDISLSPAADTQFDPDDKNGHPCLQSGFGAGASSTSTMTAGIYQPANSTSIYGAGMFYASHAQLASSQTSWDLLSGQSRGQLGIQRPAPQPAAWPNRGGTWRSNPPCIPSDRDIHLDPAPRQRDPFAFVADHTGIGEAKT